MPRPKSNTPGYCLHKRSGHAYATIDGTQRTFPGLYGSDTSRAAYDLLLAEWLNGGRSLAHQVKGCTVSTLIAAFWRHAQAFYVHPDGTPTGEAHNFRLVLRPLKRLYGDTPAAEFGPKSLKALRKVVLRPREVADPTAKEKSTERGWSRTYTNRQMDRLKMVFRWATGEEMIPPSVYHALSTVDNIRAGKEGARETEPVEPVSVSTVELTLPHLPPPVAALVRLQLLTGARGGELFRLRTCDIDQSGAVWKCKPLSHKTAHHGHERVIFFGPHAQNILTPLLKLDVQAYLFTPATAMEWRNARQRDKRKTPVTPSQLLRAQSAAKRLRKHKSTYDRTTYARAIARACEVANQWEKGGKVVGNDEVCVPHWHPHQLRHTAGTNYRREGDFEAAKIVLGHRTDSMTQRYAERDARTAEAIVARIG